MRDVGVFVNLTQLHFGTLEHSALYSALYYQEYIHYLSLYFDSVYCVVSVCHVWYVMCGIWCKCSKNRDGKLKHLESESERGVNSILATILRFRPVS